MRKKKKEKGQTAWDYKYRVERLWNPSPGWGYHKDNTLPAIHLASESWELTAGLFSAPSSVMAIDELGWQRSMLLILCVRVQALDKCESLFARSRSKHQTLFEKSPWCISIILSLRRKTQHKVRGNQWLDRQRNHCLSCLGKVRHEEEEEKEKGEKKRKKRRKIITNIYRVCFR